MNKLKNIVNFLFSPYFQITVAVIAVLLFDEFPPAN